MKIRKPLWLVIDGNKTYLLATPYNIFKNEK